MRLLIIFLLFLSTSTSFAQDLKEDTTLANGYYSNGDTLLKNSKYDSSIVYFEKAAAIYEQAKLKRQYYKSKLKIARNLYKQRQYEKAIKLTNKVISEYVNKEGKDSKEEANAYSLLAEIYGYGMVKYKEALPYIQKAIVVQNKIKDDALSLAVSKHTLAVLYENVGNYDSALILLPEVIKVKINELGEKTESVATSYNTLAGTYQSKEMYNKALEYYQKSLAIRIDLYGDEHEIVAGSYNNIAFAFRRLGRTKIALEYYEKAIAIYKVKSDPSDPNLGISYYNLGLAHKDYGNYNLGLEYYLLAESIWKKILPPNHLYLGQCYGAIGGVYEHLDEFELSLEYAKKALDIQKMNLGESHVMNAAAYLTLAGAYDGLKKYELALSNYEKSIEIFKKVVGENHPYLAFPYLNIGVHYLKRKDYDLALVYHKKSLDLRVRTLDKKDPMVTLTYLNTGEVYYARGLHKESLDLFQKAICLNTQDFNDSTNIYVNPGLENIHNTFFLLRTLLNKAKSLSHMEDEKSRLFGMETFHLCDELVKKIRRLTTTENDRLELGKRALQVYGYAIEASVNLYKTTKDVKYYEKAYYFMESNKSSVLFSSLSDYKAKKFTDIPDSLLLNETNLRSDIAYFKQKAGAEKDSTKKQEFKSKLFDLNRKYELFISSLEQQYPKYFQLKYDNKQPEIKDVQSSLDEETTLLEYAVGDSTMFAFKITKNDFDVFELNKLDSLGEITNSLATLMKEENIEGYSAAAHRLYKEYFEPLNIQTPKITIVPDGSLWQLNFDLLLKEKPKEMDYRTFRFLIKDYAIGYGYSAKLLIQDQEYERKTAKNEILAFSYNSNDNSETGNYITMRSFRGSKMVDLPGTRKEIEAVSSVFDGAYYYGSFANESNFKKNAKDYGILHLALHGVIDDKDPLNSKLYFTQSKDSLEDNFLHAYELYNLELNAELAVLSACKTGAGKLVQSEGLMSLGRAFTYAGCKSLLISQWDVSDAFTPDIMNNFYQNLKDGKSKSVALREAKLAHLENANNLTANPYFWAPLIQLGDDRPLRQNNYLYWIIGSAILALIVIFAIYKKKN